MSLNALHAALCSYGLGCPQQLSFSDWKARLLAEVLDKPSLASTKIIAPLAMYFEHASYLATDEPEDTAV
jgi:hypothetical protein